MFDLQNQDGVAVLHMRGGENRFNPGFIDGFHAALDQVEQQGAKALVTTGEGKFYSNGLDLDWMGTVPAEETAKHLTRVHELYKRFLTLPVITVAAMNGHAFAAGAMLAIAHDFRVMRSDRGFYCLPEVDIHMSFTPVMSALVLACLPKLTAHEAMFTGRRYTAEQCKEAGIAHQIAAEAEVLPTALALANTYGGKPGHTLAAIKRETYKPVLALPS